MGKARNILQGAIGQASAFGLLREDTEEPAAEIKAAKETGVLLMRTLIELRKEVLRLEKVAKEEGM